MPTRLMIVFSGLLACQGAHAQEAEDPIRLETTLAPNPLFQAQSEFALPATTDDRLQDRFGLDFTVSPDGAISNVQVTAFSGNSRRDYCDPICWEEGQPPTTFCVTMTGCPGSGGGGGGVLSVTPSPLVLAFTAREDEAGALVFDFDVEEISSARPGFTGELAIPLPEAMPMDE